MTIPVFRQSLRSNSKVKYLLFQKTHSPKKNQIKILIFHLSSSEYLYYLEVLFLKISKKKNGILLRFYRKTNKSA